MSEWWDKNEGYVKALATLLVVFTVMQFLVVPASNVIHGIIKNTTGLEDKPIHVITWVFRSVINLILCFYVFRGAVRKFITQNQ